MSGVTFFNQPEKISANKNQQYDSHVFSQIKINIPVDWCLMPTLAVFQLYHGMYVFVEDLIGQI
jgi:hypothetical protein